MKDKKYYIFFSGVLLLLILIYIILIINNKRVSDNPDITLKDEKTFFVLENILNNEYQDDYYMENQIIIDKVYYKEFDLSTAYFISAYQIKRYNDDTTAIDEGLKYEVIIKGIGYYTSKINTSNLEEYAINYEMTDIRTDNLVPTLEYKEKDKLVFYLSVFKNLLNVSPNKAYNHLTDKEKEKYTSYQQFVNYIDYIYNDLDIDIKSYEKDDNKYIIRTSNHTITLIEEELMNYKLEY